MRRSPRLLGPTDLALLDRIASLGSVAGAARSLGLSRDTAVYRIARLARAIGRPVLEGRRGGTGRGSSGLTAAGDRVRTLGRSWPSIGPERPSVARRSVARWTGTYHDGAAPRVEVGRGLAVAVAFAAEEGERVGLEIPAEAVILADRPLASSMRNRWAVRVVAVERSGRPVGRARAVLAVGARRFAAEVTDAALRELAVRPGRRLVAHVKATAIRRARPAPTRGSLRR